MDDATVFLLIFIIIVMLFMQLYFISYRMNATVLKQVDALNTRIDTLSDRVTALEPPPST